MIADGLYDDPQHRPTVVLAGDAFVDGRPYDAPTGHYIRVRGASIPQRLLSTHVRGCDLIDEVELIPDGADMLVPVDERYCRGPFTAVMCDPVLCWVAGWY